MKHPKPDEAEDEVLSEEELSDLIRTALEKRAEEYERRRRDMEAA